jgi:peroxiredoxin
MSAKNIEIVGIAIDQAANVADFVKELQIAYPVVLADASSIDLMRRLGNTAGGLPFTVVLDRAGKLIFRRLGTITEVELEGRLASII